MAIYITFLILCLMITWAYDRAIPYGREKKWGILFFLCIFLFMGLRYGVGQDYFFSYVPIWNEVKETGWAVNVESGYILINKFFQLFTDDYQIIFLFFAFLFAFFIYKTMKQYKVSYLLVAFIFIAGGFYFYSFNVMRQCFVTAIFYYTLKYVRQRRFMPFFMLNFLAFFIHKTAIIYIPFYFILNHNFKLRTYFIWLIVFFSLRVIILPILEVLLKNTKYENYINGTFGDPSSKNITVSQLLNAALFFVFCYYGQYAYKDKKFIVFKNIHFVGLLATIFTGVIPLVFRITTMFYLVQFISVPYLVKRYVSKDWKGLITFGIFIVYGAIFINTLKNNGNNIIPYQFIWQRG